MSWTFLSPATLNGVCDVIGRIFGPSGCDKIFQMRRSRAVRIKLFIRHQNHRREKHKSHSSVGRARTSLVTAAATEVRRRNCGGTAAAGDSDSASFAPDVQTRRTLSIPHSCRLYLVIRSGVGLVHWQSGRLPLWFRPSNRASNRERNSTTDLFFLSSQDFWAHHDEIQPVVHSWHHTQIPLCIGHFSFDSRHLMTV